MTQHKKLTIAQHFTKHLKLIVLLVCFSIYVAFELSLNLLLIDLYSQPLSSIMGGKRVAAERLELFGRVLSGFGLALAIVSFVKPTKFNILGGGANASDTQINEQGKWLVRPLAFLLIWLLIIPFLRLSVDAVVDTTSNKRKLAAVRAIVYKEAYLAQAVQIQGFPEFDEIAQDEARRDLFIALIPSLAYFSTGFNSLIESNLENMANHYLLNRQEEVFLNDGVTRIRQFDRLFQEEYSLYRRANEAYYKLYNQEKDFSKIELQINTLLTNANEAVNSHWRLYIEGLKSVKDYNKQYAENGTIRDTLRKYRKKWDSSRCNSKCMDEQKQLFANYLNGLEFENGKAFGIYLSIDDVNLTKIMKSTPSLEIMFEKGRKHFIHKAFKIEDEVTYEQFFASDKARQLIVHSIQKAGVAIENDWRLNDISSIRNIIVEGYRGQAKKSWQSYIPNSRFALEKPGLDRVAFAKLPIVKAHAQRILGEDFYLPSFTAGISESRYQQLWLDSQDNISFIKIATSTAAAAAFSPGGSMFELGKNAVTLAVIPPVSIAASLLAIVLLFIKICIYYWRKHKAYLAVVFVAGTSLLIMPIAVSMTSDNSYQNMMTRFAKEFSSIDTFDKAFTIGFAYVLDAESGIYSQYRDIEFVKGVGKLMEKPSRLNYRTESVIDVDKISISIDESYQLSALRKFDNVLHDTFDFVPELMGKGKIIKPYDANITILSQDMNVGMYMGLRLADGQVSSVSIPNFSEDSNIGLLLEQRVFFDPDWGKLTMQYIRNLNDPEYWLELASGNIAKTSLLSQLEKRMRTYLNNNTAALNFIQSLVAKGHANILLLELERSDRYRCFVMGTMNSDFISDSINGVYNNYEELPNCGVRLQ